MVRLLDQLTALSMWQILSQKEVKAGNKVVAVVSAMSGKTNELLKLSKEICKNFEKRARCVIGLR